MTGSRLKFDPAQADEGIFFIPTGSPETKVATVHKNKPFQLVFLRPNLVGGTPALDGSSGLSRGAPGWAAALRPANCGSAG